MANGSNDAPRPALLITIQEFLKLESAGGIILVAMMALALLVVNSPLAGYYEALLGLPVEVRIGPLDIAKPLLLWVNDGLMAIFFVLVSLEIKREMMVGELASLRQAALPAFGAVGGMAVPALIFVLFNQDNPTALRGWAIPSATDIAFSLGVLSLLGRAVPSSLKVFLAALAILDDLGAIVIIAVFYTEQLSVTSLGLGAVGLGGLILLNRLGVKRFTPYVLTAVFLWVCVLKSGIHATLAGVALGFAIPMTAGDESPLRRLEHLLLPWVAFMILPIFALVNSGLSLRGIGLEELGHPVVLGIAAGLFIGKQVGVFGAAWLVIRLGWAQLPQGARWSEFYGVAILTGIGFTMSLFIGSLAFDGVRTLEAETRLGVLIGSLASAVLGYLLLRVLTRGRIAAEPLETFAAPAPRAAASQENQPRKEWKHVRKARRS
ncbi:MAG: Na+/H+ antiporter NhaA [Alphaproteobacteria bacterium]|nr:Na+/H+ antiporter NhaA [Alphaproteobacteria bacterium]